MQELVPLLHRPVRPVLGEEVHEAVRLVQAVRLGEVGAAVDLRRKLPEREKYETKNLHGNLRNVR